MTLALAFLLMFAPPGAEVRLKPASVAAFQSYMERADKEMVARGAGAASKVAVKGSAPVIAAWMEDNPREIESALVHDWVGAVMVPGAKVADAVAVLQDVGRYPQIYSGDILMAKLAAREGDRLKVLFRVVKQKVVTVVLETEYDVEYKKLAETKTQVWSKSVRIAEVEDQGKRNERVMPPDVGWGFLWRLNTYWHLEEKDGGLVMECRAVSLTRDIPTGFGWMVKPMVTSLPREALTGTLEKTRAAVAAEAVKRQSRR